MSEIKKGALVKAFSVSGGGDFVLGWYQGIGRGVCHVVLSNGVSSGFLEVVEVPEELAGKLKELGVAK